MTDPTIIAIDHLDLSFAPTPWRFAEERRADVAAHFELLRRKTPALWNGRVLLMRDLAITDGTLRGAFFATGYADFLAWRDWGRPDTTVFNCFSMGALRTSDGAFVLGVMNQHTANAGGIYFPAGTPDLGDVRGDTVDLLGNVVREIAEETGLAVGDFAMASGWCGVMTGQHVAVIKLIEVPYPADEIRTTILSHLAGEPVPELSDVRIVRSSRDFEPGMPRFVTAYLSHVWHGAG